MGNITFTADQMFDKDLFAKRAVIAYTHTDKSKVFRRFAAGERVGKVYSYLMVKGQIWWLFYPEPGNNSYVALHSSDAYDTKKVIIQGAKSIEQIAKEAEQKKLDERGILDKVADAASKTVENTGNIFANTSKVLEYALPIAIVGAIGLVGYSFYNNADKITSKLAK